MIIRNSSLLFVAVLVSLQVPIASADHNNAHIQYVSPQPNSLITAETVTVDARFDEEVDPKTIRIELNEIDITTKLVREASQVTGVLRKEDGLHVASDANSGRNELEIRARPKKAKNGRENRAQLRGIVKGETSFIFKPSPNAAGGQSASTTIPTTGGQITLQWTGDVVFPAGAFAIDQTVSMTTSTDATIAENYNVSMVMFDPGPRAPQEITVNVGLDRPATDVEVNLPISSVMQGSLPTGYEFVGFVLVTQDGGDPMDHFELFRPSAVTASGIKLTLPNWVFSNTRTLDGSYDTVIILGSNLVPVVAPVSLDQVNGDASLLKNGTCYNRPDVHKILAPPLDGLLEVVPNSGFGARRQCCPSRPHLGVDYRTLDANGVPTQGLPVRAIEAGAIDVVAVEGGRNAPKGWGQFVTIRHNDGSKSLYAHLQLDGVLKTNRGDRVEKDEIIGYSGATGLNLSLPGEGPHLHVELVPNGQDPNSATSNPSKVDVHPCVGRMLYVSLWNSVGSGLIQRLDLTTASDLNYLSDTRPSGFNAFGTRHVAAFNRNYYTVADALLSRQGPNAFINGSTIFGSFNSPYDLTVNRYGLFVVDYPGNNSNDGAVYRLNYDGSGMAGFLTDISPINETPRLLSSNDKRMLVTNINTQRLYPIPSIGGAATLSQTLPYAISSSAFSSDRFYVPQNEILVYDLNGTVVQSIPYPIGYLSTPWGIAATEKNLYLAGFEQNLVFVFKREVSRDNVGNILSDVYTFTGTIPVSGWPMELSVE